jgi:hypothetical protein
MEQQQTKETRLAIIKSIAAPKGIDPIVLARLSESIRSTLENPAVVA